MDKLYMQLSQTGEDFIKSFETLQLTGYLPTVLDRPTIGWGHTGILRDGSLVHIGSVITQQEAQYLFLADVSWACDAADTCNNMRIAAGNPPLLQPQFDALSSLIFNIGPNQTGFLGSHVRLYIIGGDEGNTRKWWKVWNKQAGKELAGLTHRRDAEWRMWSNMGTVS